MSTIFICTDQARSAWHDVHDTLKKRCEGGYVVKSIGQNQLDVLNILEEYPRAKYAVVVALPVELSRSITAGLHRYFRRLSSSDFYSDVMWGIITGCDEAAALRYLDTTPISVTSALSNCPFPLAKVERGVSLSELNKGVAWCSSSKGSTRTHNTDEKVGGVIKHGRSCRQNCEEGAERTVVKCEVGPYLAREFFGVFEREDPDLIVASAHARECDWHPAFRWDGGVIKVGEDGKLKAHPPASSSLSSSSPSSSSLSPSSPSSSSLPSNSVKDEDDDRSVVKTLNVPTQKRRAVLACGNCLTGHVVSDTNCFATAWPHAGGVTQFFGYSVPTWYGFSGWGTLKYFFHNGCEYSNSCRRMTMREAAFLNEQYLLHRLRSVSTTLAEAMPEDYSYSFYRDKYMQHSEEDEGAGLLWDRDTFNCFGHPSTRCCVEEVRIAVAERNNAGKREEGEEGVSENDKKRGREEEGGNGNNADESKDETVERKEKGGEREDVPVWASSLQPYYTVEWEVREKQCTLTVTTLRDGSWTSTSADDKTTFPGRPPALAFASPLSPLTVRRVLYADEVEAGDQPSSASKKRGSDVRVSDGDSTTRSKWRKLDTSLIVHGRLFLLVDVSGQFNAGQIYRVEMDTV